ncbi:energy-coupling factor ABC transporter ATP-binding protein [Corynebacterium sp. sy039]|uniref:energy-coupling factor ABC transporter ATP-binding protein n=1 Tax=Corynebacterium sp. sy039 TaxID=2599641 RepID=UPI0011B7CFC9|nr:ABC transporter ATP-binding protein [Corynebacterium sp. sy039]QDZ42774.1 ABC transporter ATP-binding protein [Corynebacterium sp. sy039]
MVAIDFHNVSVAYDDHTILNSVTLNLTEKRIGIIGANGGGKSTLIKLINGLAAPTSGKVSVDGLDVAKNGKEIRKKVGFIFSDAENQIIMPSVEDDVAFSLRRLRLSKAEKKQRVSMILKRFYLDNHAQLSPHILSGGQKQLLALASVLVIEPELIIADEPTTLLDLRNRQQIHKIFNELEQQLIIVTHDLELLDDFDRVLCIDEHTVVADGKPQEVIEFYRDLMTGERKHHDH